MAAVAPGIASTYVDDPRGKGKKGNKSFSPPVPLPFTGGAISPRNLSQISLYSSLARSRSYAQPGPFTGKVGKDYCDGLTLVLGTLLREQNQHLITKEERDMTVGWVTSGFCFPAGLRVSLVERT